LALRCLASFELGLSTCGTVQPIRFSSCWSYTARSKRRCSLLTNSAVWVLQASFESQ
jgi:hypothetical protein